MVRVAVVEFEVVCQRLALLEGDEGEEDVAGERQIERGVGFAMAVSVFLPGAGVAFVVVAVFHGPVRANRACRARCLVAERLERKQRVWLFWAWRGSFFSDQSRRTVIAERAPGSPALTGEMAATAPRRPSRRPCSPS